MKADLTIFKACPDSTRLWILFLLDARELCVCELVDVLQMPQGKISRHLAVLKIAGLVHDRRDATWVYYSLASAASSLHAQLLEYLKKETGAIVDSDRDRLEQLEAQGQICTS